MSVRIINAPAPAQTLRRVETLSHWLAHLRVALALLVCAGLAASFTSTVYYRLALGRPPYRDFIEHIVFSLAGITLAIIATWILSRESARTGAAMPFKRALLVLIPAAFFASLILVALVKFSPLGVADYGARRWLDLGFVKFQPSELLKVSLVLYLGQLLCWWRRMPKSDDPSYAELRRRSTVGAGLVPARNCEDNPVREFNTAGARKALPYNKTPTEAKFRDHWRTSLRLTELDAARQLSGLERLLTPSKRGPLAWLKLDARPQWPHLPPLCFLIILLALGLTAIQPDLGTTGLLLGVSVVTCLLAGTRARDILALLAILIGLGGILMLAAPGAYSYAEQRIETYYQLLRNQPVDDNDTAYQITQGRGALAVGGLTGRGFLNSEQKMNRLPMATKDFIYPVIVEELGTLGGLVVIALFLYLAYVGMQLGIASGDPFNQAVIPALGFAVALQALVNIGTTLGTLPLSGLPLPFLSNGGTSLLVSIFSIGLIYALARAEVAAGDRELEQVLG